MHQTLTTTPTPITPPPAGTTSLTSGARLTPAFLNAQHPEATPPHTHQDTQYTRSLKLTQTDRSRKLAPHSPCLRAGLGVWSTKPAKKNSGGVRTFRSDNGPWDGIPMHCGVMGHQAIQQLRHGSHDPTTSLGRPVNPDLTKHVTPQPTLPPHQLQGIPENKPPNDNTRLCILITLWPGHTAPSAGHTHLGRTTTLLRIPLTKDMNYHAISTSICLASCG